jgi:hypothetical protein
VLVYLARTQIHFKSATACPVGSDTGFHNEGPDFRLEGPGLSSTAESTTVCLICTGAMYKSPEFRKLHDQMENRDRSDPHHGNSIHFYASLGGLNQVRDTKRAEEEIMQYSRTIGRTRWLPKVRFHPRAIALAIAVVVMGFWGCGGGSAPPHSSTPTSTPSPSINVTVTPNSITLSQGTTQSFTATVTGTTNTAVTWSVQEIVGGTIDSTGLYTAPQNSSGTFHVVATSLANPASMGIAAVTVSQSQLTISPAAVTLSPNGTQTFTASAVGFANNSVTWTVQEKGGGVINGVGFYTAPNAVGFYHVVATSIEETTVAASATVTVTTSSSRFTPTGNLNEARGLHTATLLPDNKVLVAYGSNSSAYTEATGYVGLSSLEVYDPGTGKFTEIIGEDGVGIYGHTATLLPNGNVLLAGGSLNSVWDYSGSISDNGAGLYDSATGVFSTTGNITANRGDHTATLLANGKVLIAGGADQNPTGTGLASAELYDPSTGDMNPTATVEIYDPSTGSFSATGSMAEARTFHTATLLPSGKVLVAGGGDENSTAEVYDPATGSFRITGGMEIGRSGHTATLLSNGSVLVAGGGIFAGLASAELYQ